MGALPGVYGGVWEGRRKEIRLISGAQAQDRQVKEALGKLYLPSPSS